MGTSKTSILGHSLGSASIQVELALIWIFQKVSAIIIDDRLTDIKTVFACQKLISALIGAVPPRIESFDGLIVPQNSYPLDTMVVFYFLHLMGLQLG